MDGNYKHRKTMKKRILYYIWIACAAVLLHSCEDVETHKPYGMAVDMLLVQYK